MPSTRSFLAGDRHETVDDSLADALSSHPHPGNPSGCGARRSRTTSPSGTPAQKGGSTRTPRWHKLSPMTQKDVLATADPGGAANAMPAARDARPSASAGCELTILLPCLDEAETLATCIRKARASLASLHIVGEVLIADNGSTDGSREIA